jgi:hypothetical protein
MKKVILFLLFVPVSLSGQISDNFESGAIIRWTESVQGRWRADSTGSISGKYSLHHAFDNPDAGTDQVGIQTTNLKPSMGFIKWSFKLKHGYDPSSSNNWGVFLMADNPPSSMIPGGNVNGFIIGVNLAGYDDTLRLWKIKNGVLSVVLSTRVNWQNNIGSANPGTLNIERTPAGLWKIKVYTKNPLLSDSVLTVNSELFCADWFGVYYKYSSTRDRLLWIDDVSIEGTFFEDKDPPEVNKCTFYTYSSADITLNEEPASDFFSASNFFLNAKPISASNISRLNPLSIRVSFDESFLNKSENTILIKSLCDKNGNCIKDFPVRFTPVWTERGDVIISEIMADPSPAVSLPEKEYLEIFNRTSFTFNLKKWKLSNDASGSVFPEIMINPNEQMILCQLQDTSSFRKYGKVCGLKSFPVLTDAGKMIVLSDSSGNMIHGVEYRAEWNKDNLKKDGGWSLEMIDTEFPFYYEGNWIASISSSGGTPGTENSVSHINRDRYFRGIENVYITDSGTLKINFSEPVKNLSEYSDKIKIEENSLKALTATDPLFRGFIIYPSAQFVGSKKYLFEIPSGVIDFAGNSPIIKSFGFGLTQKAAKGEVLFNEILFNPLPGDADYIELFNASQNIIDASDLLLVSVNESGAYSASVQVSLENRCILPGKYFTITTKKESIINRYPGSIQDNIYQISALPSMPDDNGHIILFNRQLDIIDEVSYNEKMHYTLLSGNEGIALEKIRPTALSMDQKNWHSASQPAGWGTPGAPNSVSVNQPLTDNKIVFSSTKISPDNDGYEDLLAIDINMKSVLNVITLTVFDESGNFIRKVTENTLSGPHATIIWDGTARNGSLVRPGIYIILITVFDDTGKTEKWKKVCTVIR